jgi:ATPase subunit of ABC transporter with duplicated ATPase domains
LIASLAANAVDLLMLDEPINHMDITSIECLRDALLSFGGALLVMSHDRKFLEELTIDQFWHFKYGRISAQTGA